MYSYPSTAVGSYSTGTKFSSIMWYSDVAIRLYRYMYGRTGPAVHVQLYRYGRTVLSIHVNSTYQYVLNLVPVTRTEFAFHSILLYRPILNCVPVTRTKSSTGTRLSERARIYLPNLVLNLVPVARQVLKFSIRTRARRRHTGHSLNSRASTVRNDAGVLILEAGLSFWLPYLSHSELSKLFKTTSPIHKFLCKIT